MLSVDGTYADVCTVAPAVIPTTDAADGYVGVDVETWSGGKGEAAVAS